MHEYDRIVFHAHRNSRRFTFDGSGNRCRAEMHRRDDARNTDRRYGRIGRSPENSAIGQHVAVRIPDGWSYLTVEAGIESEICRVDADGCDGLRNYRLRTYRWRCGR